MPADDGTAVQPHERPAHAASKEMAATGAARWHEASQSIGALAQKADGKQRQQAKLAAQGKKNAPRTAVPTKRKRAQEERDTSNALPASHDTSAGTSDSDSDFDDATPVVRRHTAPQRRNAQTSVLGAAPHAIRTKLAPHPGQTAKRSAPAATVVTPRSRATRSSMGTVHLACSAVSADKVALARKCVASLERAVFHEGEADVAAHPLTHLVIGSDTRSGKCLLAAADGAHLVTPAWLELCLKERTWLPADRFLAKVCSRCRPLTRCLLIALLEALHSCCRLCSTTVGSLQVPCC